jgi:DNA polymerase III epsilon subunit-like protein
MTFFIDSSSGGAPTPGRTLKYIFYDIEAHHDTNGRLRIWNLAAKNATRNPVHPTGLGCPMFNYFVANPEQKQPYGPPAHPDLFQVTHEFLRNHGAQPFKRVALDFMRWMHEQTLGQTAMMVLVSHGNFKLDKKLLEEEFGRAGLEIPNNWYFYDTLNYLRNRFRGLKSYSLKNIHQHCTHLKCISHQHFALPDVIALETVMRASINASIPLTDENLQRYLVGAYYPAYVKPLQCLRGIGFYHEGLLIKAGIVCVEALLMLFVNMVSSDRRLALARYLVEKYHVRESSAVQIADSVFMVVTEASTSSAAAVDSLATALAKTSLTTSTALSRQHRAVAAAAVSPHAPPHTPSKSAPPSVNTAFCDSSWSSQ